MTIFYVELSWNCKIKYKRNKRQSKRGEWEKRWGKKREGGRVRWEWKRKAGLLLPQERFQFKNTQPAFLSNSPNYWRTTHPRRDGGSKIRSVWACVRVARRPSHLIFQLRRHLSVRYTLTHSHTHKVSPLKYLLASCGEISEDYPQ